MLITRTSILSQITRSREIPIREEDYKAWGAGATIQSVAGYLSADDREFIISGITPEEWDQYIPETEEIFGEDDDEPAF